MFCGLFKEKTVHFGNQIRHVQALAGSWLLLIHYSIVGVCVNISPLHELIAFIEEEMMYITGFIQNSGVEQNKVFMLT